MSDLTSNTSGAAASRDKAAARDRFPFIGIWRVEFQTAIGRQLYLFDIDVHGRHVTAKVISPRGIQEAQRFAVRDGSLYLTETMRDRAGKLVHVEYEIVPRGRDLLFTRRPGRYRQSRAIAIRT